MSAPVPERKKQKMSELVWSLAGTHCVWCGLPKATETEWQRNHDDAAHTDDGCWCMAWCWDCCDGAAGAEDALLGLRAMVEAQAAVIARYRGGWRPAVHPQMDWHGYWWGGTRGYEPMTEAEKLVVYGEEADT